MKTRFSVACKALLVTILYILSFTTTSGAAALPFCDEYASRAHSQDNLNERLKCGFRGGAWHQNERRHYKFCKRNGRRAAQKRTENRQHKLETCKVSRCNEYSSRSLSQNRYSQKLKCGFQSGAWHPNKNRHFRWCMDNGFRAAEKRTSNRQQRLENCKVSDRAADAGDQYCREYASRSLSQNRLATKLECSFEGGAWHSNERRHQRWCETNGNRAAERRTKQRQQRLESCKRNSNAGDYYCGEYASRSLSQNRLSEKLKCGFDNPAWHANKGRHQRWCEKNGNKAAERRTAQRQKRLERCKSNRY